MNTRLIIACLLAGAWSYAQEEKIPAAYTLDANAFYGSIILHNPDISHLIRGHPAGLILSVNRKTFGQEAWEQDYNFPDLGFSFVYQHLNNPTLGENFGLYAHYNFYFLRRHLQFRIGQGIAYNTNPYDKNENFRNNAYGTHLLSTTYLTLNVYREEILKGLGFKAGIALVHYSNANVRAPNTSTNTFSFNYGLIYSLDGNGGKSIDYVRRTLEKYTEPIRFNLAFRTGVNESDVVNSGQYPFFILSGYADKRVSRKSAVSFGADIFLSNFLKELIRFQAISFPEYGVNAGDDHKRIGIFTGHELFIGHLGILAQLGYYVYYPFDFEGRVYNRVGLKRYFGRQWYGAVTLKSHGAKAEAVEFGVGVRL